MRWLDPRSEPVTHGPKPAAWIWQCGGQGFESPQLHFYGLRICAGPS